MATDITTEAPTTQLIGQAIKRVEDPRLVTGAARYRDHLKLPGVAHVAILRSPYAHARIGGIRTEQAAAHSGVIAVFTGSDFAHLNPLPCAWQAAGTEKVVATPRAPEVDRVTFTGAGVAAVVAETEAAAEDALALIEVDWEPLPVVVDPEAAVAERAPQIHENAASNIVMDWTCGDAEATEQALAEADVVVEQRLVNQRLIPTPMETRGDQRADDPAHQDPDARRLGCSRRTTSSASLAPRPRARSGRRPPPRGSQAGPDAPARPAERRRDQLRPGRDRGYSGSLSAATSSDVSPTVTVQGGTSRINQVVTLVAVIVPPLATLSAMGLLWGVAFHWRDLLLLAGFYVLCAFGTTIGFHRYFTHRGFTARKPVEAALAILGCMTMQGPLTQWVTDHRKHHALSDQPGDPHSPHVGHGDGAWGAVRGFVHAHVGWLFNSLGMEETREYGKDLYENRLVRAIDRLYLLWVGLTLGVPFLVGYAVGGTLAAGFEGLVWGGLIRIFLYQHATFSVNSICHMFGRKDYRSRDEARNNWLVALLVFGEGWHNNHHAFPSSARHGLRRWQIDVSWWVIRGMEKLRLVWDVKVPDERQQRRRAQPAEA